MYRFAPAFAMTGLAFGVFFLVLRTFIDSSAVFFTIFGLLIVALAIVLTLLVSRANRKTGTSDE